MAGGAPPGICHWGGLCLRKVEKRRFPALFSGVVPVPAFPTGTGPVGGTFLAAKCPSGTEQGFLL